MTVKEYLKQYEYADNYARKLRAEYEREQDLIDALSINMDGMPHGSNISRPTEEKALKLTGAFIRWKDAEIEAIRKRQTVFETIVDIPGVEGDVLYERYVNLHKWEEICILLHYSWNGIHQAHKRALRIVEERVLNGTYFIGKSIDEK